MTVHAVANQLSIKIFTLTLSSCLLPREDPSKSSSYSCSLLFLGDCSTKVCSSSSLDWSRSAGGSSKLAVSPALLSGRVSSRRLAISESCSFAPLSNYQENTSHFNKTTWEKGSTTETPMPPPSTSQFEKEVLDTSNNTDLCWLETTTG